MPLEVALRKQYTNLSCEEVLQKAYDLGFNFEKYAQSCSQSTVAALHSLIEIDDVVIRVATSICGGSALQLLGTCGALSGGIIALDYFFGRNIENMSDCKVVDDDLNKLFYATSIASLLADKFIQHYGTFICAQLQRQLYGRVYWVADPKHRSAIHEAGAHSDPNKCVGIVGNAARWVVEILFNKGIVTKNNTLKEISS